MARMEPDKVAKRSAMAWSTKSLWRDLRESAYELALPHRNPYHSSGAANAKGKQQPGARKMNRVFDSTLMTSTVRFANRLQSELVPPFQRWGKLVPGAFIPDQHKPEIQKQLDNFTDAVFAAISVSNFDTAINEFFLDLSIGTGVMMVMDGDGDDDVPVNFVCVPQSQVALEEGPHGAINGLFRQHSMKARLIEETWEGFKINLPDGFQKDVLDNPEKDLDLIEATYWDNKEKVWYYDVILQGPTQKRSQTKQAHRLIEHQYDESPWIVARWVKVAGEVEGRGPVLYALPDAKTLNKLKELVLMNASIAVSGVWTAVDDGVLNPNLVRIQPGAVIPVARNGGALGASLQSLTTGADFNVASIIGDELVQSIKQIMLDDQLPPETGAVRSATEIIARMKQLQADIGSPFGRLMTELLRPLIQKILAVLSRKKIIALQPGQRLKVTGGTVDIQLQSPLAQAQNLADVQSAVQWVQIVQTLGQEAFLLGVNVEDFPAWLADKMGVDGKLVRSEEQRQQAMQMVGALSAQQGGALPAGQPANDQGAVPPQPVAA